MCDWCMKWRLQIIVAKNNVIHFRKKTGFNFTFGPNNIAITCKYKYLCVILDKHLTFQDRIKTLNDSTCQALSGIIPKFKCC